MMNNYIKEEAYKQQAACAMEAQSAARDWASQSGHISGSNGINRRVAANQAPTPAMPITESASGAMFTAKRINARLATVRDRLFGEVEPSSVESAGGPSSVVGCVSELLRELESAEKQLDSILSRL